jgi:endonuclease/exonuclease/phosphatase (EEP) superfamily protein YafD
MSARVVIQVLIVIGTVIVLVALLRAGWVGDVVGLAMPAVAAGSVLVVVVLLLVRPGWCAAPATVLVVGAYVVLGPRWAQHTSAPVGPVRLAAVNLQFDTVDAAGGVRDAVAVGADVLVVSELTPATDDLLRTQFPYRVVTDDLLRDDRFGEGVYARIPLTKLDAPAGVVDQFLRVAVAGPTPFVLYAAHLYRPTFQRPAPAAMIGFPGQRSQVFALDRAADLEGGPVVIAGDLNLSDRTSGYRRLATHRIDATRTGWAGSTFHGSFLWSLLLLRIDHVFVPDDWCARSASTFHLSGSDHDGVVTSIGRCPGSTPNPS